jgi:hypothetical protein
MDVLNLTHSLGRSLSIKGLCKIITDRCEKTPMKQWLTSLLMLGASPLAFLYPWVSTVLKYLQFVKRKHTYTSL